jgi:DeoR family fructose operon transcriptional repressor
MEKEQVVSTSELAVRLSATQATIRRDLDALEDLGLISRSWGKATLLTAAAKAPPTFEREASFHAEKTAIAKAACAFISEGDSIVLDSGTTIAALAAELAGYNSLRVVTNSLLLPHLFAHSKVSLQYTGGFFERDHMSLVGPESEQYFDSLTMPKAFISTTGMRRSTGFSTFSPFQASVKRHIVACASKVYLLMDSSKTGAYGINSFASFSDIDVLITTKRLEERSERDLIANGVELVYAGEEQRDQD